MKAVFLRLAVAASALALTACATTEREAPSQVARFHLGQPIARGQIAVEAFDPADQNGLEFRAYADAVARQLTRLGWTVVPNGQSEQVAMIDVEQGSREALARRSPISIGIGGSTGGYRSGVGVGVGVDVPVGRSRSREIVGTELEVRIKRRSNGEVFWEGRASTEARADAPLAQRTVAVEKLADALFRDFPGESGRTISVP
ncbi:DUF4136 domain-containing protein [Allosphingosinicella flava]|uniref:DUF4136 domain-containing protein n=1 Tax=Allosphingosinicella flava TaxID=2771430 RepID=A0A7T2GIX6_9SPHN|nr:DUF4136 domain-containing protein [Sphingosinicella flava]QPQ54718.1 DUF4136 domain-containing protein [Sphingosinicella flava]